MKRLGLVLVVLALAGCTPSPTPTSTPTTVVSHAAAVTGSPTPSPNPTIPNGVVATGTLESSDIATSGSATITKSGDLFVFTVSDLQSAYDGQILIAVSDSTLTLDSCAEDNNYVQSFTFDPKHPDRAETLAGYSDDASFLTNVLVVQYPLADGTTLSGGCEQKILALAPLTWTVPDVRPNLVVHDTGSAPGAEGSVDGDVYTTVPDDNWDAIATRFGVSPDDLNWLNPLRPGKTDRSIAYAGELLNLSKTGRSDSKSRRPH